MVGEGLLVWFWVQAVSERMNSGLGVVGRSGMFWQRRLWFVWMLLQVIVLGSFEAIWGCGSMQGRLCWVRFGRVWGWRQQFGIGIVPYLAWMLSSCRFGGFGLAFMGDVEFGLMNGLRP